MRVYKLYPTISIYLARPRNLKDSRAGRQTVSDEAHFYRRRSQAGQHVDGCYLVPFLEVWVTPKWGMQCTHEI